MLRVVAGLKKYCSSSIVLLNHRAAFTAAALACSSRSAAASLAGAQRVSAAAVTNRVATLRLLPLPSAAASALSWSRRRRPSITASASPMRGYAGWRVDYSSASGDEVNALRSAARLVPELTAAAHKGQYGKVGVLGGCREYTGAPYFAALSAVKVGADLAHVICTPGAAPVIKGYSPELIVLPFLPDDTEPQQPPSGSSSADAAAAADADAERRLAHIRSWLAKLSVLVVGPGLGDDPRVVALSRRVVQEARSMGLPLLIDGSGLNFVAADVALVRGYGRCVLTPNLPELGRLAAGAGVALEGAIGAHWQAGGAPALARALAGPVVVSKGPQDWIVGGDGSGSGGSSGSSGSGAAAAALVCTVGSSPRRAGGQGDVVAGAIAAFMCWAYPRRNGGGGNGNNGSGGGEKFSPLAIAAYGGCAVVRAAATRAFAEHRRSMLATDVIAALPAAFEDLFEGGKGEDGAGSGGGEGAHATRSTL